MKGAATESDLFTDVNASMDKLGLKWDRLVGVTTDDCPNLTGRNVGLLQRMEDELWTETDHFELHYSSGGAVEVSAKNQPCCRCCN